ncbi:MAG: hypothetical protein RBR93_12830 [Aliarcobacter butzleri]|nr:hypothetical protein [Aliarcobacter butzleri]
MQLLEAILDFIKSVIMPWVAYKLGSKTKENEKLKDENAKLKEYESIENGEHSVNDAYNARMWK